MEVLKPIREGIEKLSQATQPLRAAEEEEEEEEPPPYIGRIAENFLNRPTPDKTFGVRGKEGKKKDTIFNNKIEIEGEKFEGTPGLWELRKKNQKIILMMITRLTRG